MCVRQWIQQRNAFVCSGRIVFFFSTQEANEAKREREEPTSRRMCVCVDLLWICLSGYVRFDVYCTVRVCSHLSGEISLCDVCVCNILLLSTHEVEETSEKGSPLKLQIPTL
jgi:hypothetical protein